MVPKALLALLMVAVVAGCASSPPSKPVANDTEIAAAKQAAVEEAKNNSAPEASEKNATLGSMPHLHDYWKGRERVTVYEGDSQLDAPNAAFWTLFTTYLLHEPIAGGTFIELPEGQLVFEGTGELDITATWSDATVTGMRVTYHDAGHGEYGAWKPLASNKPMQIPVDAKMSDMPHTKHSRWSFIFAAAGTPAVAIGKVHIKIEIVKSREIELFPAHPDFWHGTRTLDVLKGSGVAKSQQGPMTFVERQTDPLSTPKDLVKGDKPIPMETMKLVSSVTIKSVNPDLKIDHLHLFYRAANDFSNQFHDAGHANKSADGKTWTWEIPIEMDQTDNPYNEKSDWAWRVTVGYVNPVAGLPPCDDGCYNAEMQYDLGVVASQDRVGA